MSVSPSPEKYGVPSCCGMLLYAVFFDNSFLKKIAISETPNLVLIIYFCSLFIIFVDSLSTPLSSSESEARRTVKVLYRDCKDEKETLLTAREKRKYIS